MEMLQRESLRNLITKKASRGTSQVAGISLYVTGFDKTQLQRTKLC